METVKVRYDGTTRNGSDDIVEFLYGEDGMEGTWVEDQAIDLMNYDNKKLEKTFRHDYHNDEYGIKWLPPHVLSQIKSDSEVQAILDKEWDTLKQLKEMVCTEVFPDGDSKQHMPINISRMIGRAQIDSINLDQMDKNQFYTPMEIVTMVDDLMASLEVSRGIVEGDTIGREVQDNATILLNAHLRGALGSKKLLQDDKLSKQS